MVEPLRILFVEDSETDAELEARELRKGGIQFVSRRVEKAPEVISALRDFKPGLIISDYSLPNLDGRAVLRIVQEHAPDVPFIFVSGTFGEDRAIESLKGGATDYVLKDFIGTLVPKVRRALTEVEERAHRRRVEYQLGQAQKMEAIGRLAGGVAHDFNNLLTVINGYSEMIFHRVSPEDPSKADADEILRAGRRAASLTRQLLAFSRRQILSPVVLNINATVAEMDKMLRRMIGEDVELVTALDPKLGNAMADPGQIEQVIMNLAVNARDAMPKGGKLTLETTNLELDEGFVQRHPGARAGAHVMLAVSDTGVGMDPETQARLFEPFFTTKEQGQGTGLGLSTVYGIVKQSGGSIWVYSELGKGTSFKIYLPRVGVTADSRKATNVLPGASRGTESILVVEDSPGVRKLMEAVLRARGYGVILAEHGESGLELLKSHAGPLDLLLSDIVLPRMSGPDLAVHARSLRPGIKVLHTSGYTDRGVVENGLLRPGTAFLQKPFTAEELARKVRTVLDSPA